MAISLITSEYIAAALLLVDTFLIGTLPAYIGSKISKRRQFKHQRHENLPPPPPITSNEDVSAISENQHPVEVVPELQSRRKSIFTFPWILSFLMNFGAGVLFATVFVHMLPEAIESFEDLWPKAETNSSKSSDDDDKPTIPRCEFLLCAGFFLVFLVEEIAHGIVKHTHGFEEQEPEEDSLESTRPKRKRRASLLSNGSISELIKKDAENYGTNGTTLNGNHMNHTGDEGTSSTIYIDTVLDNCSEGSNAPETKVKDPISILRCLLIVIALSFHSIFDGLAIGLQTTTNHLWQLFIAVSLHKSLIAFVVGLDVYKETLSLKRVVVYMLPFSIVSPVGLIVAAYAKVNVGAKTSAILSAIATGSLFYITFFEMMFQERSSKKGVPGYVQLIAILLGFILFSTLSTLMPA